MTTNGYQSSCATCDLVIADGATLTEANSAREAHAARHELAELAAVLNVLTDVVRQFVSQAAGIGSTGQVLLTCLADVTERIAAISQRLDGTTSATGMPATIG